MSRGLPPVRVRVRVGVRVGVRVRVKVRVGVRVGVGVRVKVRVGVRVRRLAPPLIVELVEARLGGGHARMGPYLLWLYLLWLYLLYGLHHGHAMMRSSLAEQVVRVHA